MVWTRKQSFADLLLCPLWNSELVLHMERRNARNQAFVSLCGRGIVWKDVPDIKCLPFVGKFHSAPMSLGVCNIRSESHGFRYAT